MDALHYDEFKDVLDLLDRGKINTEVMIFDIIPVDDLIVSGFESLAATNDMVKILTRRQGWILKSTSIKWPLGDGFTKSQSVTTNFRVA